MTPQVAGVLFIFLWLIVSQLATKLSYRRRLDKVINMMTMMINMMTLMINMMTMRMNLITMMTNMKTMKINLMTIVINLMTTLINIKTMMIRSVRGHDDVRIRLRLRHSLNVLIKC